MPYVGIESYL